eukprot:scaffold45626_cov65-Cyclotella_meneghiniana.AAC.5
MKHTFAFVGVVMSSAYFAPVTASKAFSVSEIIENIQDKIVHLDKKDVTKKQNLRYSWDAVDVDVSPSFDTCLPVGYDISKLAEDYTASAEKACDFCCSKKCSAFNVVQKIGGFKDADRDDSKRTTAQGDNNQQSTRGTAINQSTPTPHTHNAQSKSKL